MAKHDTPSTARTEAARRYEDDYNDRAIFEAGAEWALAQVREGLIMEVGPIFGDSNGVTVKRADALAVVDRLRAVSDD